MVACCLQIDEEAMTVQVQYLVCKPEMKMSQQGRQGAGHIHVGKRLTHTRPGPF